MAYLGAEFISNTTADGNQSQSALVGLADGRFLVTWSSNDLGGDIRGRLFAADGSALGSDFIVNSTPNNQQLSAATELADGNLLVTWTDYNFGADHFQTCIRARILASDGTPIGSDFIVNSTIQGSQDFSTTTALSSGRFLVSWHSPDNGDGSSLCIRARLFEADGTPVGDDFIVNSTVDNFQAYPDVTELVNGNIVIAWRSDDPGDGSSGCIRARLFGADGTPIAGDFVANTTALNLQERADVAALAGGGFVMTWRSNDDGDSSGNCIRARVFAADGTAAGDDFIVNSTHNDNQYDPAVAALADGSFMAAWLSDEGSDGSGGSIRARLFNADGSAAGDDFIVNATFLGNQSEPSIAVLADGRVAISFTSEDGGDGSGTLVRTVLFDPDGGGVSVAGTVNGDVITGSPNGDTLSGGDGIDTVLAGSGGDTLDGGTGADSLYGGMGDDTYFVDDTNDQITEFGSAQSGIDHVTASANFTLGANIEDLTLAAGAGAIYGAGNNWANVIVGNESGNVLLGFDDNDTISGGLGADSISGGTGSDTIDGGAGADTMDGGAQADLYIVDNAGDVVSETDTGWIDLVKSSVTFTLGANIENLTLATGAGAIDGTGNGSVNIILGNESSNSLSGLGGADTLDAGNGSDTLDGGGGDDSLSAGAGDNSAAGGADNDTLDAGNGNDTLDGGGGNDSLTAGAGDNSVTGGADNDRLDAGIGADTLDGGDGDDMLNAGGGNDSLLGGSGGDTLDGKAGADTMAAGTGADGYYVDDVNDQVIETDTDANDVVFSSITYTLGSNVEQLFLADGAGAIDGTGNSLDNYFAGNDGANKLSGLAGADTMLGGDQADTLDGGVGIDVMDGGVGNDTFIVDDVLDQADDSGGDSGDAVESSVNYVLLGGIETLTLKAGAGAINGIGNNSDNLIIGNESDNVLDGGGVSGNDTLNGGLGNDTASYAYSSFGNVVANLVTGKASEQGITSDVLISIENIDGSAGSDNLTGDAGDNRLSGQVGDDTITGGGGNNVLDGGGGAGDVINYSAAAGSVSINIDTGIVSNGQGGTDTISGFEVYNTGTGNDVFIGAAGDHTLSGGAGEDRIDYSHALDAVSITILTGVAGNGFGGTDAFKGIEDFTGSAYDDEITGNAAANAFMGGDGDDALGGGSGGDALSGNAGDDGLVGGSGNDTLDGGDGDDVMKAGSGNDMLIAGAGDNIMDGGSGSDTADYSGLGVAATINLATGSATTALSSDHFTGIENVVGTGLNDQITGNGLANLLNGGLGTDTLSGGAGADTLNGGGNIDLASYASESKAATVDLSGAIANAGSALGDVLTAIEYVDGSNSGNDRLIGDGGANRLRGLGGNDTLDGGAGRDTVQGGAGGDVLQGGGDIDTLYGDAGNDTLDGGGGRDVLEDSSGADIFAFKHLADMGIGATRDTIIGFSQADDLIDLSGVANFTFVTAFHGTGAAELRAQTFASGMTLVLGDVDGNKSVDFQIELQGLYTLTGADFI